MSPLRRLCHRILVLAAVLLPALSSPASAAPAEISPDEALARAKAGELTLVDVRSPREWRETGVAAGALRLDMNQPDGADGFVKAVLERVGGDRNAPLAFICRTGNRSGQVQRLLAATRNDDGLDVGASPRSGLMLLMAAKSVARFAGRDFVTPDDVKTALIPALRHRVVLNPTAELEGTTTDDVLSEVVEQVEVPR